MKTVERMVGFLCAAACLGLCGGTPQPRAALADPLVWLYDDTRVETVKAVTGTDVPRNGVAEAAVLLNGLTPGKAVSVASDVPGVEWFRCVAVSVVTNTGLEGLVERKRGENPHVARRAPFRVYDALAPLAGDAFVPDGATAALRVRLRRFPAGARHLPVRLRVAQGAFAADLAWTVTVHAVDVPPVGRESFKYTNWMNYDSMALCHGIKPWSEAHWAMIERYLRLAVYGRQSMVQVPWFGGVGTVDEAKTARFVALLDKLGVYWLEGPHLASFLHGNWRDKAFRPRRDAPGVTNRTTSAGGARTLARAASTFADLVARRGWADRWYQHVADEPSSNNVVEYRLTCGIVRKYMPGVRLFDAVEDPDMAGALDAYCPKNYAYEKARGAYEALRTRPTDELWCYTCCFPGGPWMNRLLDNDALAPVLLPWGCARFKLDGYLHWGFNQFTSANDPLKRSSLFYDAHIDGSLPPGDRNIVYAGPDGPWPSVRLEAMRQGCEDLELLRLLARKDPGKAEALVNRLVRGFGDYTRDVAAYRAVRGELLATLAKRSD